MMSKKAAKEAPKEAEKLKPMAARAIAVYARLFSQITTPASDKEAEDSARVKFASDIRDSMQGHTFKAVQRAAKAVFTSLVGKKLNRTQKALFRLGLKALEVLSLRPPSAQAKDIGNSFFARVNRTQMLKLAAAQVLEKNKIKMTKKNFSKILKAGRSLIPAAVFKFVERTFGKSGVAALDWADKNLEIGRKSQGLTLQIRPKGPLRTAAQALKVTKAAFRFADEVQYPTSIQAAMQLFIQRVLELWYGMQQEGLSVVDNEGYRGTISKAAANEAFQVFVTTLYGTRFNAKVQVAAITLDAVLAFHENVVVPMHEKLEKRYPTMKGQQLSLKWKDSGGGLAFTPMPGAKEILTMTEAFGNASSTISKYLSGVVNLCYVSATGTEQERIAQAQAFFLNNRTYAFTEERKKAVLEVASRIGEIANWDTVGKTAATMIGAGVIFKAVAGLGALASSPVTAPLLGLAGITLGIIAVGSERSKQQAEEKKETTIEDEDAKEEEREEEKEEEEEEEDEDLTPIDNMDPSVAPPSTGGEPPRDTPLLPAPGDETAPVAQVQEQRQDTKGPTGATSLVKNIVEGYNAITAKNRIAALKSELEEARKANKLMLEREQEQLLMTARAEEMDALRRRIAARYQLEDSLDELSNTVVYMERRDQRQQLMDEMQEDYKTAIEKEGNSIFRDQTTAQLRTRIAERGEQLRKNLKKIVDRRSGLIASPVEEKEAEIVKTSAVVDAIEQKVRREHGHYLNEDQIQSVIKAERKKDTKMKKEAAARDKQTKMDVDDEDEFFDASETELSEVEQEVVSEFKQANADMSQVTEEILTRARISRSILRDADQDLIQDVLPRQAAEAGAAVEEKEGLGILSEENRETLAQLRNPFLEEASAEREAQAMAQTQLENARRVQARLSQILDNAQSAYDALQPVAAEAKVAASSAIASATDIAPAVGGGLVELGTAAVGSIVELPATLGAIARDELEIFGLLTFSELVTDVKSFASYVVQRAPGYIRGGQFVTDAVQSASDLLSYGRSRQPGLVDNATDALQSVEFTVTTSLGLAVGETLPRRVTRAEARAATETLIGTAALIKTLFDDLGLTRVGMIIINDIVNAGATLCVTALQYVGSAVIDTAVRGVRAAPMVIGRVIMVSFLVVSIYLYLRRTKYLTY